MSDNPPERKPSFNWKSLTTKKVGGIPLIYILLVLAVILLYAAFRMKRQTSDEPAPEVDPVSDAIALPIYDNPQFVADAPQGGNVRPGSGVDGGQGDDGVPDPVDPPDPDPQPSPVPDEPSEPIPAPTPSPAPVPAPTPAPVPTRPAKQGEPPCWHTIRGGQDNGPGDLALLYYGKNNAEAVNQIIAHNSERPLDASRHWAVGTRIHIPPLANPQYFTATNTVRSAPDIAAKNGVAGGGPEIKLLNPSLNFPVPVGTRVRVK